MGFCYPCGPCMPCCAPVCCSPVCCYYPCYYPCCYPCYPCCKPVTKEEIIKYLMTFIYTIKDSIIESSPKNFLVYHFKTKTKEPATKSKPRTAKSEDLTKITNEFLNEIETIGLAELAKENFSPASSRHPSPQPKRNSTGNKSIQPVKYFDVQAESTQTRGGQLRCTPSPMKLFRGYKPPVAGLLSKQVEGYAATGYIPPATGYAPPVTGYLSKQVEGYAATGYVPPDAGYLATQVEGYVQPVTGFVPPVTGFVPPGYTVPQNTVNSVVQTRGYTAQIRPLPQLAGYLAPDYYIEAPNPRRRVQEVSHECTGTEDLRQFISSDEAVEADIPPPPKKKRNAKIQRGEPSLVEKKLPRILYQTDKNRFKLDGDSSIVADLSDIVIWEYLKMRMKNERVPVKKEKIKYVPKKKSKTIKNKGKICKKISIKKIDDGTTEKTLSDVTEEKIDVIVEENIPEKIDNKSSEKIIENKIDKSSEKIIENKIGNKSSENEEIEEEINDNEDKDNNFLSFSDITLKCAISSGHVIYERPFRPEDELCLCVTNYSDVISN